MVRSRRTRGKTRAGRLERLDNVLECVLELARGEAQTVVELGFGASSVTAREWFTRVHGHVPDALCVGVEVDMSRVARAQRESVQQGIIWKQGGFDFTLPEGAPPLMLVRALNVLRQYDGDEADAAHMLMATHLAPGGVLIEGSSDRGGDRLVVHMMRRGERGLEREALLCVVNTNKPFAPRMLRDWLPQDVRRGVGPAHPVFRDFLSPWMTCFEDSPAGPERFSRSVTRLAEQIQGIEAPDWMVERGALMWRPAGGVPGRAPCSDLV